MAFQETLSPKIWAVLIRVAETASLQGGAFLVNQSVPFEAEGENASQFPSYETQRAVLEMLCEERAIKIESTDFLVSRDYEDRNTYFKKITILHPRFDEMYKKYNNKFPNNKTDNKELPRISYNSVTGIGSVDGKPFKFKDHQPEFRVFELLFNKINEKIIRYDVLVATHFYEDGEDINKNKKTLETANINNVAKRIRKITGLSTEQLILNNGNLTLLGKKME